MCWIGCPSGMSLIARTRRNRPSERNCNGDLTTCFELWTASKALPNNKWAPSHLP